MSNDTIRNCLLALLVIGTFGFLIEEYSKVQPCTVVYSMTSVEATSTLISGGYPEFPKDSGKEI